MPADRDFSEPEDSAIRGALSADWLRQDVEQLLRETPLPRAVGDPAAGPRHPATVLITGATGFLGSRVLLELLRQTEAEIVCLVRASGARAGHERLAQAFVQHGLSVRTEERRRLGVVAGDLARPYMGLARATWDELAERVDCLYHLAAQVNLIRSYEALRPDNVVGTFEVLRLWSARRPRWLHHVSALPEGGQPGDEDLSRTQWVHGGYAQSKWAAQWLVRRAASERGGASCYRPGLIAADSRGGPAPGRDFLTLLLRGLARLGCLPPCDRARLRLDVTPVDFAARALVHISLHAAGKEADTFPLASPRAVTLAELAAALERAGLRLEEVDAGRWRERLLALHSHDAEAAAACLALCRGLLRCRPGVERVLVELAGAGIICPPVDETLLDRQVSAVLRS
jgi:thioester reductase-like protein